MPECLLQEQSIRLTAEMIENLSALSGVAYEKPGESPFGPCNIEVVSAQNLKIAKPVSHAQLVSACSLYPWQVLQIH